MAKRAASAHDNEGRKTSSHSRRQSKVVSIKKDTKKPARQKATKATMAAIAEPIMDGPSVDGDMQARIAERAYELHHHRGGHHGQDLEDWLTAEREVLSEESCS
jgi:hypothetical protein